MTPQTVTITTARGETFTMNFDGPVSVEVKDAHLSPFEVGDLTPPQSTAPKFRTGDVVYWENSNGERRYGRVTEIEGPYIYFKRLVSPYSPVDVIGQIGMMYVSDLHHDYRTVAGGGWRKCEVGKVYKTLDGKAKPYLPNLYIEDGFALCDGLSDLCEELP